MPLGYLFKFLVFFLSLTLLKEGFLKAENPNTVEHLGKAVGTTDYAAYYCAYQLYDRHQNPYNEMELNNICSKVIPGGLPFNLKFMYPPILLPILSPILNLDFRISATSWYISNLIFLLLIGMFVWKSVSVKMKIEPLLCSLSALIFPPAFESLEWGQISIFVTLSIAAFFYLIKLERDIFAGFALNILLLKFHLFLVFFPFLFWWIVKEKRIWIAASSMISLYFLYLICELRVPGIHSFWMDSMSNISNHGEISKTASISGLITYMLGSFYNSKFLYLFPSVGILLSILLSKISQSSADFPQNIFPILCLSLIFAPYAWFHDFTCLLPLQIGAVATAYLKEGKFDKVTKCVLLPWIGLQLFTVIISLTIVWSQHQLFWYPFASLAIWYISLSYKTKSAQI